MKSYSVIVGARQTPACGRRFSRADEKTILNLTRTCFPRGFTILSATGSWFDPVRKTFLREESRQIIVTAAGWTKVRLWSRQLARALRQKEVIVTEVGRVECLAVR